MHSFDINVAAEDLHDLHRRLRDTRWSPEFGNDEWSYGVNGNYLRDLTRAWHTDFDWRRQEQRLNELDHRRTVIDGVPLHYIRARGVGPAPMPLILTHGWPWTFLDWLELIGPLSDPARYGGDPHDAFDVVVPSLPGFIFSSPLQQTGIDQRAVARRWASLMQQELGYDRYAAAGGDWGAAVSTDLGLDYADNVIGVYLSTPPIRLAGGGAAIRPEDYSPEERDWYARMQARLTTTISHVAVQTHDPQTLAWALGDSPVGLLAWLLERRRAWSDCDGDVESVFSRDFLLTTASLYWFTNSIGSSFRLYAETFRSPKPRPAGTRLEVPTGIGVFPGEVVLMPKTVCERVVNLTHWSVLPKGGHFAPSEQPVTYVDELRRMFRPLRGARS